MDNLLRSIAFQVWVPVTLVVLGVLLVALGVLVLVRGGAAKRRLGYHRRHACATTCLLLGVPLLSVGGLALWRHPQGLLQLFRTEYSDVQKLEELKTADLENPNPVLAPPGEWPQWRGPNRDGIVRETGLLAQWPANGPTQLWRRPIRGGFSSITVSQGRLYTMDRDHHQERVLCLDADSGKEIWIHRYDADYEGINYSDGPRATPTVHGDRVYTFGATGMLFCLNAAAGEDQGKVIWKQDARSEFQLTLPTWGLASSPLVEGDLVIVQPGGAKSSIVAFNRHTGAVVWKALSDRAGYSSPVAADAAGVRQIICFTGDGLAGLNPSTGEVLWYYDWPTEYQANIATPIVAGNYVFISSDYGAGCALVHLSPAGPGRVQADPVYVKPGKVMRNHHSSCVLYKGHLYGFDVAGPSFLKCVDIRTAEEKWYTRNVAKGSVLYADGHLIVLTEDGDLVLVEATPEGFRKRAQATIFESSQVWAVPTLAAGRLYLRDNKEMVCLDLRASE